MPFTLYVPERIDRSIERCGRDRDRGRPRRNLHACLYSQAANDERQCDSGMITGVGAGGGRGTVFFLWVSLQFSDCAAHMRSAATSSSGFKHFPHFLPAVLYSYVNMTTVIQKKKICEKTIKICFINGLCVFPHNAMSLVCRRHR